MKAAQMGRGGAAVAFQTLASAGLLFWTYRAVNAAAGAEDFGVWATVVGVTPLVGLAELGVSTSVLRQAAVARAEQQPRRVAQLLETGVTTVVVLTGAAGVLLWAPLRGGLHYALGPSHDPLVDLLLPLALLLVVSNTVGLVMINALDVLGHSSERAVLMLLSQVLLTGVAVGLVGTMGVKALLLGQLAQSVSYALGGWWRVRRHLPHVSRIPWRWKASVFRALAGYGARWQALSLPQLLVDPLMRWLLGRFGGTVLAGQYEFASKVALQARTVGVAALQTLVPRITELDARGSAHLAAFQRHMQRWADLLAAGLAPMLCLSAPLAAALWSRPPAAAVAALLAALGVGWSVNLVAASAYLVLLGQGRLRPLGYAHAATLAVLLVGGPLGGAWGGGAGVVAAYVLALVAGAAVLIPYIRAPRRFSQDVPLYAASALGLLAAAVLLAFWPVSWMLSLVASVVFALLFAALLFRPPGLRARWHLPPLPSP